PREENPHAVDFSISLDFTNAPYPLLTIRAKSAPRRPLCYAEISKKRPPAALTQAAVGALELYIVSIQRITHGEVNRSAALVCVLFTEPSLPTYAFTAA